MSQDKRNARHTQLSPLVQPSRSRQGDSRHQPGSRDGHHAHITTLIAVAASDKGTGRLQCSTRPAPRPANRKYRHSARLQVRRAGDIVRAAPSSGGLDLVDTLTRHAGLLESLRSKYPVSNQHRLVSQGSRLDTADREGRKDREVSPAPVVG